MATYQPERFDKTKPPEYGDDQHNPSQGLMIEGAPTADFPSNSDIGIAGEIRPFGLTPPLKRTLDAQPPVKKHKFSNSGKSLLPTATSFRLVRKRTEVVPDPAGLLEIIHMVSDSWEFFLKKTMTTEEARSVLLLLTRETLEGYLFKLYQTKYPDYRYHTQAVVSELPEMISTVIGRLCPWIREGRPDVVLNVQRFLDWFDLQVAELGWEVADYSFLDKALAKLKSLVATRNAVWQEPIVGESLLGSGCRRIMLGDAEQVYPVMSECTSRRSELLIGMLDFRGFVESDGYLWPVVDHRESSSAAALSTYNMATEPWTERTFRMEFFGPINSGEKTLAGI